MVETGCLGPSLLSCGDRIALLPFFYILNFQTRFCLIRAL